MGHSINHSRVSNIIRKRLVSVAPAVREFLPPVLSRGQFSWAIFPTKGYLLVVFISEQDKRRIQGLIKQSYDPFPGLITQASDVGAAFRFENSRNMILKGNAVENAYSISLGQDSTIILEDHKQCINTQELGKYKYTIPLAYLISYGDEVSETTVYDYLEDLMAYSISVWRLDHAG